MCRYHAIYVHHQLLLHCFSMQMQTLLTSHRLRVVSVYQFGKRCDWLTHREARPYRMNESCVFVDLTGSTCRMLRSFLTAKMQKIGVCNKCFGTGSRSRMIGLEKSIVVAIQLGQITDSATIHGSWNLLLY